MLSLQVVSFIPQELVSAPAIHNQECWQLAWSGAIVRKPLYCFEGLVAYSVIIRKFWESAADTYCKSGSVSIPGCILFAKTLLITVLVLFVDDSCTCNKSFKIFHPFSSEFLANSWLLTSLQLKAAEIAGFSNRECCWHDGILLFEAQFCIWFYDINLIFW